MLAKFAIRLSTGKRILSLCEISVSKEMLKIAFLSFKFLGGLSPTPLSP